MVGARARDAGRRSELRIPGIAAQTRMVSLARIRRVSRKSPRIFKRIICDDVSEFESHMPSHAVWSLWRYPVCRNTHAANVGRSCRQKIRGRRDLDARRVEQLRLERVEKRMPYR